MFRCIRFVPVLLLPLAFSSDAMANAWSVIGFDGESIGKGGALTGGAEGPAAMFYNPAGVVKLKKERDVVSYVHGRSFLSFDPAANDHLLDFSGFSQLDDDAILGACDLTSIDEDNLCVRDYRRYNEYLERGAGVGNPDTGGVRGTYQSLNNEMIRRAENTKSLNALTLGYASPLTDLKDYVSIPIALGGAVFVPMDPFPSLAYQRIKGPTTPYFVQYDDNPHRILVDLGGAAELADGFRVGFAIDFVVNVNANIDANLLLPAELRFGSILAPDPNVGDIAVIADGRLNVPLVFTPVVGVQYSPTDEMDFGVTYRDEQSIDVSAKADVVLSSPFGDSTVPMRINTSARFQPRSLAAGAAWRPIESLGLFADVTWKQWSRFKPIFAIDGTVRTEDLNSAVCDLIDTFVDLEDLLDIAADADLIPDDGICSLIESNLEIDDIEFSTWDRDDNKFKDTINPAFGLEFVQDKWMGSVGYRYEPNPVPEQAGMFNILGASTHAIGTYFAVEIIENFASIGFHGQYRLLQETTTTKSASLIEDQTDNADAFPDLDDDVSNGPGSAFNGSDATLDELADYVDDTQILNAGFPSYTVGGGFLTAGIQLTVNF